MNNKNNFNLLPYLAADLRRAQVLMYGENSNLPTVKFWLGIFSPRFIPVLLCRVSHFFYEQNFLLIAKFFSLLNFFFFGIEIAMQCSIGEGLFLPHTHGTVIGAYSIGRNATIFQGVTLGARELNFEFLASSRPILGDDVTVGAGAKVLGGLSLGSGSRIGANAVVLESIPANVSASGVPARIKKVLI